MWDGHIFINLATRPDPLPAQLADLPQKFASWRMQDLQMHKRIVYEVQANWKLIVINYNECLHCPVLHPCLNRLTNYLGADNSLPQPTYIGGAMGFRGDAQTMSLDGRRRRDYLPGLNDEQRKQVYYYAIYPNLFLSLHPDYMMAHTLWPRAVDRTEVVCEWHFHPAEMAKPDFHADDAIDLTGTSRGYRRRELVRAPALPGPIPTAKRFPMPSTKWFSSANAAPIAAKPLTYILRCCP